MNARNVVHYALLQFALIALLGCSDDDAKRKVLESVNRKALLQRELIDGLILDEMKKSDFRSSKQAFCTGKKGSLFDFLIGSDIASYPQLASCGDTVSKEFLDVNVLQDDNVRKWMVETGSENEYLAFATDIWDFRTQGVVQFFDTLILAIHDGKIVAFRFFAEVPY